MYSERLSRFRCYPRIPERRSPRDVAASICRGGARYLARLEPEQPPGESDTFRHPRSRQHGNARASPGCTVQRAVLEDVSVYRNTELPQRQPWDRVEMPPENAGVRDPRPQGSVPG